MLNFLRRRFTPLSSYELAMDERAWIKEMSKRTLFTPDAHLFNRTVYQLLFIYGNEQRGHIMHERLIKPHCMNNKPAAVVFTENEYTMMKKKLGWATYPIVADIDLWNVPKLKVKGELYAIRSYMIPELDRCYSNTVDFMRQRITVTMPHHLLMWSKKTGEHRVVKQDHITYQAWAYLGIPDFWKDELDVGYSYGQVAVTDPNNHSQLQQYYSFTHAEYKIE